MSDNNTAYQSDEITIKEAVHVFGEYWKEIKKSILLLILFVLPFLAYNLYKVFASDSMFPAELSFMLNEKSGNSIGAISGLLGQIGLDSGGDENLDKILELSKSQKISNAIFFGESNVDGKSDYLGNHIINMLSEKGKWAKKGLFASDDGLNLEDFSFKHDSIPSFTLLENKALKLLHAHLIGNKDLNITAILNTTISDNSGIMKMIANTYHPEVSIAVTKSLYNELTEYYISKTIEKQQYTFDILQTKTDSIFQELKSAEFQLANFQDKNQSLFARTDQLTEQRLSRDIQKLSIMYGEATKNLELADFSLKDKTPFIQLIDEPFLPIKPNRPKLLKSILSALILGLFLGTFYIVCRKIFRDALS